MPNFSSLSTQAVFVNGKPEIGAKIFVYDAGTNTPRTAYSVGDGSATFPHPFTTDANGCIPPFWIIGSGLFKVVITTRSGKVIRTVDNIPAVGSGSGGTVGGDYLPLSGGVMAGPITLPADPTTASQAATKRFVESYVNTAVTAINSGTPLTIPPPPNLAVIDVGATTAGTSCPVEGGSRWDATTGTLYVCHSGTWAAVSTGSSPTPTAVSIPTGFLMPAHMTGAVEGWVRANGRTIGNAISGATERANLDTKALFKVLWANDTTLAVSGGRGISSDDDFNLGKTIALPDYRARTPIGMADMGGSNSTRLSGVTFTSGTALSLGAFGGNATRVISTAELPAHAHTGSATSNGAHVHTGTSDNGGAHTHTYLMDLSGPHNHSGTTSGGGVHSHGGSTLSSGDHVHGGTAATAGNHSHTISDPGHSHSYLYINSTSATDGLTYGNVSYFRNVSNTTGTTTTNITVNSGGDHSHAVTLTNAGTHTHSITTDSALAHTHSFTSGDAGNHKHTLTIGDAAAHSHAFTTDSNGAHTHALAIDTVGGSSPVEMMQPFITCTYYIKL